MAINKKMQSVLAAMEFASIAHRDQRRKDDFAAPYINHPIALAKVLVVEGGVDDAVTLQAAILHDTVEDTGVTLDQLRVAFGDEVASVVAEVSDDKSLPKEVRKQLQVQHAAHCSKRAKLVKISDKICNIRDLLICPPVGWSSERVCEYILWAEEVVNQVRGTNAKLDAVFDRLIATAIERDIIPAR